ncbi:alpha-L-fucosidase [Xanthocytophaga agilis]|uniref:alpha-L-fucosidase n=1 Tax=Xanthocytophaga agilis TaxID=3048010 RepID=A0AAE3RC09_9BACT|nr:alpha-L-fucosidase [Xanthocytophaga agilis]MDJ1505540.1 alpha-L-fucosidase [Xanthocytophaga agilis]
MQKNCISLCLTQLLLLVVPLVVQAQNAPKGVTTLAVTPQPRQLAYQQLETIAFIHYTVNAFTDKEWGDGTESPKIFNPDELDVKQWVKACKDGGLKQIILTAKHHDGFCLWPSKYTEHSIKNSPYKGGKGDIVKELSEACRESGIKFGIYLSPWDRHEPAYGTSTYNEYYKNQLRELLTNYGEISEVWMDGAKGENAKNMEYDFEGYRAIIRELQPKAVIFSDAGPDVRWIGNEKGFAGETNWSLLDKSSIGIGQANSPGYKFLNTGQADGKDWLVGECDVSIRPGWFYHAAEDSKVKSLEHLLDIYYKSVGRNAVLLLNLPPDRRGLIHENDVERLKEFRTVVNETFRTNLALNKSAKADHFRSKEYLAQNTTDGSTKTFWATEDGVNQAMITIPFGRATTFDRISLAEPIEFGQRVNTFTVEAFVDGKWEFVAKGTTIGYKRLLRIKPVTATQVRMTIGTAGTPLLISEIGIYKASAKDTGVDEFK